MNSVKVPKKEETMDSFLSKVFESAQAISTEPLWPQNNNLFAPIPAFFAPKELSINGSEDVSGSSILEKRIYALFLALANDHGNVDRISLNGEIIWTRKQGG